jgi:hypothetical protein
VVSGDVVSGDVVSGGCVVGATVVSGTGGTSVVATLVGVSELQAAANANKTTITDRRVRMTTPSFRDLYLDHPPVDHLPPGSFGRSRVGSGRPTLLLCDHASLR